ncbi:hypothetical protein [Companilactobacillus sp. HBUAS56275]|uniref:Lipoprotein n=1 Tax=Candidatus Companilactobacillus pullicola TaxID=2838523 RepID=A0A9D1ZU05_9LACO|nr:hypothetical protein [Candidatus Companilactobacillus pullicola]
MRKLNLLILTLILLFISGCSASKPKTASYDIKANTQKIIKSDSKTWIFNEAISSKQTGSKVSNKISTSVVSKANDLDIWTTSKGEFKSIATGYKQTSFSEWKKLSRKHYMKSYQKKLHYMSVQQVNEALKALGAKFEISKMSDLVFLKPEIGDLGLNQAFVAKGHKLYAIDIQYMDVDQTTVIDRGKSFTDTQNKKSAKHLDVNSLNGTWIAPETTTSAEDSGKILVKNGYLYQHRYNSFERSAIQDLSKYSLISLNQNSTYALQKREAAHAGYQLSRDTVASGDSIGYLYLFTSEKELIRIGAGKSTKYQKNSDNVSSTDLPQNEVNIFTQADTNNPKKSASTITTKAGASIVGISSSVNYLTDPEAGQIISEQEAK